ncbi:hypothetical protein [Undibacterium pigrum]|uniref:Immunity protein 10 of polymorphic toxin system n=1 Tax=Undibacterium pigrum TaxID=401470 RepID=A0A318J425_9BURK|nr:hypothetical protein [Undibacterium pigrum]PXX41450.1 hypothetical protein DFR42_107101 [Undibacterium pigrum]
MIIQFSASEAAMDTEYETVTTGVTNGEEYLLFQRHEIHGDEDDTGVYIEYQDQCQAGENIVASVSLSRNLLTVILAAPLYQRKEISSFEICLNISDAQFTALRQGLEFTFWDRMDQLLIVE